jgi:uncharacterized membrane protein YccF (DUF307 family)
MRLLLRIVWFALVGWWLGLVWFSVAVLLIFSIVFAPIGTLMAMQTWRVMTLRSSPRRVVHEVRVEADAS